MRREIQHIFSGEPVHEGAGVKLHRAFGYFEAPLFDPFLMLDDFRSDNPEDYLKGFPWHPHRGIETITYLLKGDVEHGDSLGNSGITKAGNVQWMTAGSGIIHQEMPKGDGNGSMHGFQLWANLSSENKMVDPEYREISAEEIPVVKRDDGSRIKVIAGKIDGIAGPAKGIGIDPEYLDVSIPQGFEFIHPTKTGYTAFIYITAGEGTINGQKVVNRSLVLFDDGDELAVNTDETPLSFLLLTGKPIKEPIFWRGPIVMHTAEELEKAFKEYENGTFIKHSKPRGV
jgi:redox-sensitive bicupin YhaK (pirin superfamily)